MVKYVYNEDGEIIGEYPERKSSRFGGVVSSISSELKYYHQMLLKKRDEASRRNEMLNKMYKRRKRKFVKPDYNINHAHHKIRTGW